MYKYFVFYLIQTLLETTITLIRRDQNEQLGQLKSHGSRTFALRRAHSPRCGICRDAIPRADPHVLSEQAGLLTVFRRVFLWINIGYFLYVLYSISTRLRELKSLDLHKFCYCTMCRCGHIYHTDCLARSMRGAAGSSQHLLCRLCQQFEFGVVMRPSFCESSVASPTQSGPARIVLGAPPGDEASAEGESSATVEAQKSVAQQRARPSARSQRAPLSEGASSPRAARQAGMCPIPELFARFRHVVDTSNTWRPVCSLLYEFFFIVYHICADVTINFDLMYYTVYLHRLSQYTSVKFIFNLIRCQSGRMFRPGSARYFYVRPCPEPMYYKVFTNV